jgi:hypothetical protein
MTSSSTFPAASACRMTSAAAADGIVKPFLEPMLTGKHAVTLVPRPGSFSCSGGLAEWLPGCFERVLGGRHGAGRPGRAAPRVVCQVRRMTLCMPITACGMPVTSSATKHNSA